jgi:hypothetical protein
MQEAERLCVRDELVSQTIFNKRSLGMISAASRAAGPSVAALLL